MINIVVIAPSVQKYKRKSLFFLSQIIRKKANIYLFQDYFFTHSHDLKGKLHLIYPLSYFLPNQQLIKIVFISSHAKLFQVKYILQIIILCFLIFFTW
jgi:hypothetical protein